MRYVSVCSGIEAASMAWEPLGWEPVAFSEIEPFPAAVLKHHWPKVPNMGDMTKHEQWTIPSGSVDLLVGGTPCQSFSVAGLRQGLKDPRGNLMLTFLAIAERLKPRWIVWENVPGVLSSNGGKDFGSFLGALGDLGYGWAYRVLDAQWFGVAQRRRRVFVVGHLGNRELAAKVLFESESVRRDTLPSREKRKRTSSDAQAGVGASSQIASMRESGQGYWMQDDVAGTIDANMGMSGHSNRPAVIGQQTIAEKEVVGCLSDGAHMGGGLTARTHTAEELWQSQAYRMQAFGEYMNDETASAMKARDYKDATDLVAIPIHDQATRNAGKRGDKQDGKGNGLGVGKPGDQCPDGPRYKALGNSMAVPCMAWIGKRIDAADRENRKANQ